MATYNRMTAVTLQEPEAHQLFQSVAEHYAGCVGGDFGDIEDHDVPSQVRVVCRLWNFLAEIGGGGINDYLWNHCFSLRTLRQVHADLVEIGAIDLKNMLEAGVRLSLDTNMGEFLEDPGAREWAAQFSAALQLSSDELDTQSAKAAYPAGSEVVAGYIRQNIRAF